MIIIPERMGFGFLAQAEHNVRKKRRIPPEGRYQTVPDIVALGPEPGAPPETMLPESDLPDWDPTEKYAFHRRPKFSYDVVPTYTGTDVAQDVAQGRRVHRGRRKEADIDFTRIVDKPYKASRDSEFVAKTVPVRREFAIMPDLRPEGEYELPSYELMAGLGADIVRVPGNVSFDELDRQLDRMRGFNGMGIDPVTIMAAVKGAKGLVKKGRKIKQKLAAAKKGRERAAPVPEEERAPIQIPLEPPPSPGLPSWVLPVAIGGGVLIIGAVLMATRK